MNARIFRIIKFKTMTDAKDAQGNLLGEEHRITPTGKFVRKYSIDEIPQLINVVKGDMSLIGPRPLLTDYLSLYDDLQKRRHEVRPGITGWAQVNGRNAVSWDQRFSQDIWYVDHISFALDCRILFYTFRKVLRNEGGTPKDAVVMKRFMGNKSK
jgi:undecaprenyl phosphate N,N'-diacetylbacillosamine 1-phosphate transferase